MTQAPVDPPPLARATKPIVSAFKVEVHALLQRLRDEPSDAREIIRHIEGRCDYYVNVIDLIQQGGL